VHKRVETVVLEAKAVHAGSQRCAEWARPLLAGVEEDGRTPRLERRDCVEGVFVVPTQPVVKNNHVGRRGCDV